MKNAKIQTMLMDLEDRLPQLLKDFPAEEDFYPVFAAEAEAIAEQATPDELEWVESEITTMLSTAHEASQA